MTQEDENNVDKDALAVIDDPALLNLSEDEMLSLVEKKPEVQAKKRMSENPTLFDFYKYIVILKKGVRTCLLSPKHLTVVFTNVS